VSTARNASTVCAHDRQAACWETPDFIIAPNLWLLNMSNFSPVDYRILTLLQEWVCQCSMRDVDKLRQRLIDRQTVTDQATDRWWFRLRHEVDIWNLWHSPMFYYWTALLVHTFSYFIWRFI